MNYGNDSGRQSYSDRPSYRYGDSYSGGSQRSSGSRRNDSDEPVPFGDEPRWRYGDDVERDRPDYGSRSSQRTARYEADDYSGGAERWTGRERSERGYGESSRMREYGNGERPFENSTDRSWPGEMRGWSGGERGESERGQARERGRSYTNEPYGGSFAGPYAQPEQRWSRQGQSQGEEYRSRGNGDGENYRGSYAGRSSGSTGSSGSSAYGSEGRWSISDTPSWGTSMRERESHRGRGPKGYRRTDERIQEELHDRLTDAEDVDASEIEVSVKNGEITLSGTVRDRSMKRRAEDIAEQIARGNEVQNNIRVQREGQTASTSSTTASLGSASSRTSENRASTAGGQAASSGGNAESQSQQQSKDRSNSSGSSKSH